MMTYEEVIAYHDELLTKNLKRAKYSEFEVELTRLINAEILKEKRKVAAKKVAAKKCECQRH